MINDQFYNHHTINQTIFNILKQFLQDQKIQGATGINYCHRTCLKPLILHVAGFWHNFQQQTSKHQGYWMPALILPHGIYMYKLGWKPTNSFICLFVTTSYPLTNSNALRCLGSNVCSNWEWYFSPFSLIEITCATNFSNAKAVPLVKYSTQGYIAFCSSKVIIVR